MGILSKLMELGESVNDAADQISSSTIEDYGDPAYYLFTALDLRDIHQKINITDEQDNVKYYTRSSIIQIKGKTEIMDPQGNIIAFLEKKPISLHEIHYITMADGRKFTLSNELLHVIKDVTNIEGLGWKLNGNIIGLNFNLTDENGEAVASVGKRMVSIHDKYTIDIYKPEEEQVIVAIVIQLEKMIEARNENKDND